MLTWRFAGACSTCSSPSLAPCPDSKVDWDFESAEAGQNGVSFAILVAIRAASAVFEHGNGALVVGDKLRIIRQNAEASLYRRKSLLIG